jgi:sulfur-carrier protein adenylyltransferase/sulfurtransferase
MTTFRDLLSAAKSRVDEIDTAEAVRRIDESNAVVLDVREADEWEQGGIGGAIHIPRGHLEAQVEHHLADKAAPVVVYCAGGTRSAFAADTLRQLGYTNVASMAGGFEQWKADGRAVVTPRRLTVDQARRYRRHTLLPEIGEAGQLALLDARVLLIGAGGLGSPAALYLAAAGVGTIGIVDMDEVDDSNLQRQILHNTSRVGQRKVASAATTINELNQDVEVVTYDVRLGTENVLDIVAGWDVVVDGADNFDTRYLLNDATVKLGIPVVHGSIFRFEGQVTVFDPKSGPTYRDYLPTPPPPELAPSCAEAGVLGALPGIVGTIQAVEAIKIVLGLGESLRGRLLVFDALDMSFSEFRLAVAPDNKITWANRDAL